MLKDTRFEFGSVTKFLHWVIAFSIIAQFYLIYRRWTFDKDSPESTQYILLHKSIGMTVLILGIVFITWRIIQTRPPYPPQMARWEIVLAKITQWFLFFTMLAMPISGYMVSMAGGHSVAWFGLFEFPKLLTENKEFAKAVYPYHQYISYALIGFFILHLLGALKHHFISKDNILLNMLPGHYKPRK